MTLAEWLEQWLGQMSATLRPGTLEHYRRDMENHVVPYLGKKMLSQVTAADLRKLYGSLKKNGRVKPHPGQSRGLSSTTVYGIHTTLHHALRAAVEQGLIPINPAAELEPPKVIRQPMNILNEEQLVAFTETIRADPIWHDFFYTELTTGLRLGKICGLMWADFDGRVGALYICRTLHREKGGRLLRAEIYGESLSDQTTRGIHTTLYAALTRRFLKSSFSATLPIAAACLPPRPGRCRC